MKAAQRKDWERARERGKKSYLMRTWVLYFGVGLTVLTTIFELISSKNISLPYVAIRLVVFSVVGLMIGNGRWEMNERRYEQALEEERARNQNRKKTKRKK
ncbi:hypothetical protein ABNB59_10925 [Paenibacillus larvae]|uniref:Uncharacterized protein n=3 Tax=Paenibacillus larvae TaxID=1464 RepID=V9W5K8_9BACL|nr:hypothetical protein [Paenibacillus larvae]AHD04950.1 hypothetical protein ERIC2_c11180 [Paenibacillus larvae subsp. larvae DSM 25430]AQR78035.1 hypothetical protein BXP28_12600 [Paenibacillus larvae subsp. larvae]AVF20796.1 hypothetical protein ERICI_00885 [Paenibacillus larvae subsp. larvae]AVG11497.1 hypothetical protein ERICII_01080 [Paenibacillus larvae subsp. larvae DSM 25430]ETK28237.1 hypothetical protein ERIC1_1c16980 [Paenibacillus larvae subsp. larvae DSM 25719]